MSNNLRWLSEIQIVLSSSQERLFTFFRKVALMESRVCQNGALALAEFLRTLWSSPPLRSWLVKYHYLHILHSSEHLNFVVPFLFLSFFSC